MTFGLRPNDPHPVLGVSAPPRLARAKERTGKSWRWLAKRLEVSDSHLLEISQSVRCPSRSVAVAMEGLPFDEGERERLCEVAVVGRGRDRR